MPDRIFLDESEESYQERLAFERNHLISLGWEPELAAKWAPSTLEDSDRFDAELIADIMLAREHSL